MIQWINGHLDIVWPQNVATNGVKPEYPKPAW
jgi:hypothetical protein